MRGWAITAATGALALLLVACSAGGPPAPSTDYTGPSPPGAVARLGRGSITTSAFSPDGKYLVVGGKVGLYLHEVATLAEVWRIPSTSAVTAVAFSRDGALIAAGLEDGKLALVDAAQGRLSSSVEGPSGVTALAWTPEEHEAVALLAVGLSDGQVFVWSIAREGETLSPALAGALDPQPGPVTALAYSADGSLLAAGSLLGGIQLWEAWTGLPLGALEGHRRNTAVTGLSWAPDGQMLVSGGRDGQVIVWDTAAREARQTLSPGGGDVLSVAYAGDGETFVSLSEDGTVTVWETATGAARLSLPALAGQPTSGASSADGTRLAAATASGTLGVWDISRASGAEQPLQMRAGYAPPHEGVDAVAWSPDGTRLATGAGRHVLIWDAKTNALIRPLDGHTSPVTSLAWSPDGRRLVSGSRDRTLIIWDVGAGEALRTLSGHSDAVASVAWSPDGRRLASAGSLDDSVIVWDARSGEALQTLHSGEEGIWSVAWSPDGGAVAAGTTWGEVLLWHADGSPDEEPFGLLVGHTGWVTSLAWSPDGSQIAAGSADATVMIWDTSNADRLQTLGGHSHVIRAIAYSPDGTRIASVSQDRTVVVQDATAAPGGGQPGRSRQVLAGHTDRVASVAWSPDGTRLASGSDDGTVIVWDMTP